jgi:hypothetical protein
VYVLLATVGVLVGLVAVREYGVIKRVENEFVETRAEVTYAKVEKHVIRSRRGGVRITYRPEAVYRYSAGDGMQTGTMVAWYQPKFDSEYEAEEYLAGLCQDGSTVCYVDPTDPATAVLDRHVDTNVFSLLVTFGGAFVLLGVMGFAGVLWFRANKVEQPRIGWNEIDVDRPVVDQPILLSATPPPAANDPLARTRALMAAADRNAVRR